VELHRNKCTENNLSNVKAARCEKALQIAGKLNSRTVTKKKKQWKINANILGKLIQK
jgi:hypothetical protein